MRGILVLALAVGSSAAIAASTAHGTGHSHGRVAISDHWAW
jgi:hypothetical protein